MFRKRYRLDREKLLYRQVRLSFKQKLVRFSLAFTISLILAAGFGLAVKTLFGTPKEEALQNQLAQLKYQYSLLHEDFKAIDENLNEIASAESSIYRPVLDLQSFPENFRISGMGGSKRYEELEGYENSDIMISAMNKIDELERKAVVQSRSFEEIIPSAEDWKNRIEHIPSIRPVTVGIPLGEGIRFRDDHPVLHISRWHYGQDFRSPSGTEVYATGAGIVRKASWTPFGFGNRIEIDHGYGFRTIYAHLSNIIAKQGQNVQRGDLIGLSGSTGVSSGPHMHYEVHLNGRVQKPTDYFSDILTSSEYKEMIASQQKDTVR